MSPLYLYNNKLLIRNGKLANAYSCCCKQCPPNTDAPLISLSTISCIGADAIGVVTEVGGLISVKPGPITKVMVTNQGNGYAMLGRIAPTLSATATHSGVTNATFTVNTSKTNGSCGDDSWSVESISVSGGTGYTDNSPVTISAIVGDTVDIIATAKLYARTQPTVTATVSGGTGAVLSVTLQKNAGSPDTWGVSSVTVIQAGNRYFDNTAVSFSTNGTTVTNAVARISIDSSSSVAGRGPIKSVTVTNPGAYYLATNIPSSVVVTNPGRYWREDTSVPAYVPEIIVIITQIPPSNGAGAEISAIVDDNPNSITFGQVLGFNIDNAGDSGYQAYGPTDC